MDLTSEHFESVGLTIWQPSKGHRYGSESLALAAFCELSPHERVVEFGSGVGVISLVLAAKNQLREIVSIEIQGMLHEIALKNVRENECGAIVRCVHGDFRNFSKKNRQIFDVVVTNPPFYSAGNGRLPADAQRAAARHELSGTLSELLEAAKRVLRPQGRLAMVFKNDRYDELVGDASSLGFEKIRDDGEGGSDFFLVEFLLHEKKVSR